MERFLKYLEFKGKCAAYQQENSIGFDRELALDCIQRLEEEQEQKVKLLKEVMPVVPEYKEKNRPKVTHKKDGEQTKRYTEWLQFLREHNKPPTTIGPVRYVSGYTDPNPNSSDQVKEWLFSLGWGPCTYKYVREDAGERKIPQVRYSANGHPRKGELTDSVLLLKDKEPGVEHLEGLTVVQHRLGIFRGFVESAFERDGQWYLRAEIHGLTNTFRFKHKKPLVNLPGVDRPWGKEVRGCLIAPEGYAVVGADMVSLESTTKRHLIYPIDPEYAEEMSKPGFDEHLDLAEKKGEITKEDYKYYINCEDETDQRYKSIKRVRTKYKPINYAAVYNAQPKRVNRETGMPIKEAKKLLDAYWKRNWAVRVVAERQKTKVVNGITWLQNPVSGFWHELRKEGDRFSTLNQGTGVYIFDSWLARCAKGGYMGNFQSHDETMGITKDTEVTERQLQKGIERLNDEMDLNVTMAIDIKVGKTYAEVH